MSISLPDNVFDAKLSRLRHLVWASLGFILMLDGVASLRWGLTLPLDDDTTKYFTVIAAYGACAFIIRALGGARLRRYRESCEKVAAFFEVMAQFFLFIPAYIYFSYVMAAASSFAYADRVLLAVDRALGFDWLAYVNWVDHHPYIARLYTFAYMGAGPVELLLLFAVLAISGRLRRMYLLLLGFFLCATICIIISSFVPATGIFTYLHLNNGMDFSHVSVKAGYLQVEDLNHLRDGTLRRIPMEHFKGMITFPSYHACIATLLIWGAWAVPVLRWIYLALNIGMLAATPVNGGHYLCDTLAGLMIVTSVLYTIRRLAARHL